VVNMRARCWRYPQAVWMANEDCYEQLATLSLGEGSAQSLLFLPSRDEETPDFLAGRPIFFSEYCESLGGQGDLILGVWSQYIEGTYQTGNGDSMHVRFLEHERAFKFYLRNDGSPWWLSPLTPQNTSTTLSPFVVLQERSGS
jgi:HK97 family phage major capsid protein